MNEKFIEKKLVEAVRKAGGLAPKFVSPGLDGVPDRIVLLPASHMAFVELKAPGKMMRPLQVRRKKQLESLGFKVYCIDEVSQIGGAFKGESDGISYRLISSDYLQFDPLDITYLVQSAK